MNKYSHKFAPQRKLAILAIFLHSMQQKWDQGTLGRQRLTLIGSRTRLGPSMDPAMALQYTKHGPLYIDSQYIKGHVGGILGPWQGPLKDQEGS